MPRRLFILALQNLALSGSLAIVCFLMGVLLSHPLALTLHPQRRAFEQPGSAYLSAEESMSFDQTRRALALFAAGIGVLAAQSAFLTLHFASQKPAVDAT